MADDRKPPSFWGRVKAAPLWVKIVVPIVVFIAIVAAIPSSDDNGGSEATTEAATTEAQTTTPAQTAQPTTTAAPAPATVAAGPTDEDLRSALDDADPTQFLAVADSLNVKQIERSPGLLSITLETPEGGLQGPSEADLDGSAGAAFNAVYADADWQEGTTVRFTGGLVDSRTGRDLPNATTGLYRLTAREARRIDWDNAESVDWSLYRLFAHPALKD